MFKNNVFRPDVDTIDWFKNAGIRAVKTIAQSMLAMLTAGQLIVDVDWKYVLSVSLTAGFISILNSILGIPETKSKNVEEISTEE